MQSHSVAHPELQPRQRLEKPGAIIEYANAPGPFTVSLSVALDEIRAEALIWDTGGSQNSRMHKAHRAGTVDETCSNQRSSAKPVMTLGAVTVSRFQRVFYLDTHRKQYLNVASSLPRNIYR